MWSRSRSRVDWRAESRTISRHLALSSRGMTGPNGPPGHVDREAGVSTDGRDARLGQRHKEEACRS